MEYESVFKDCKDDMEKQALMNEILKDYGKPVSYQLEVEDQMLWVKDCFYPIVRIEKQVTNITLGRFIKIMWSDLKSKWNERRSRDD